jgi:hypothetical protein
MNNYKDRIKKDRLEFAEMRILELGFDITSVNKTELRFEFNGSMIYFFPFTGWHSGKTIQDGRGLNNLLKQLI